MFEIPAKAVQAAARAIEKHYERCLSMTHDCCATAALTAAAPILAAQERARITANLKRAAEGRREYANGLPEGHEGRRTLDTEGDAFESAALVVEDPLRLVGLVPTWMFTDEEEAFARSGGQGPVKGCPQAALGSTQTDVEPNLPPDGDGYVKQKKPGESLSAPHLLAEQNRRLSEQMLKFRRRALQAEAAIALLLRPYTSDLVPPHVAEETSAREVDRFINAVLAVRDNELAAARVRGDVADARRRAEQAEAAVSRVRDLAARLGRTDPGLQAEILTALDDPAVTEQAGDGNG